MTPKEYKLLVENNIMLKILAYIKSRDSPNIDFKEFTMNAVANLVSSGLNINKLFKK